MSDDAVGPQRATPKTCRQIEAQTKQVKAELATEPRRPESFPQCPDTGNNQEQPPPIYSEETVGRLLMRLNLMCVKAVASGDSKTAVIAARYSAVIEEAMKFAGVSV